MKHSSLPRILVALLLAFTATAASAYDFYYGGFYYKILPDCNSVCVTYRSYSLNSDSYGGEKTIPSEVTYDGVTYAVTKIGDNAFKDCYSLISVIIPESVTIIEPYAFTNCEALTTVDIPNTVTYIGEYAFSYCSSVTSVDVPNSVAFIGDSAFYGTRYFHNLPDGEVYIGNNFYKYKGNMPANTSIQLKEGTVSISSNAFEDCTGLTSIVIPNSVTTIGKYAFKGCNSLTSVDIPNSVISIGGFAFEDTPFYENLSDGVVYFGKVLYRYKGLMEANTSVVIKEGTVSISPMAFSYYPEEDDDKYVYNYINLTSVTIPNTVTSIGEGAFANNYGLSSITIPNSVTKIEANAFNNCRNLTAVTLPNSLEYIEYGVFEGCSKLSSLNMPDNLIGICDNAFQYSALNSITFPNTLRYIGYYAFDFADWTSITIPDSVTYIGYSAFSNNKNLTSVVIGNGIKKINDLFDGCPAITELTIGKNVEEIGQYCEFYSTLTKIVCLPTTPPISYSSNFTSKTKVEAKLYVPDGCEEAYKQDYVWRDFFNILGNDEVSIEDGVEPMVDGRVLRCGDALTEVYTLTGAKVFSGIGEVELAPGAYILASAGRTSKVMVR